MFKMFVVGVEYVELSVHNRHSASSTQRWWREARWFFSKDLIMIEIFNGVSIIVQLTDSKNYFIFLFC